MSEEPQRASQRLSRNLDHWPAEDRRGKEGTRARSRWSARTGDGGLGDEERETGMMTSLPAIPLYQPKGPPPTEPPTSTSPRARAQVHAFSGQRGTARASPPPTTDALPKSEAAAWVYPLQPAFSLTLSSEAANALYRHEHSRCAHARTHAPGRSAHNAAYYQTFVHFVDICGWKTGLVTDRAFACPRFSLR